MVKEFLDFINSNNLCSKTDKILVTVSGGVDSVVLATLFKETGFNFAIAHCNFQLRGADSNADQAFVIGFARKNNIPYFVDSFHPKDYASFHHVSIQMAARDLRYAWFKQLADDHGFNYIATAHHLDDSLETALFNFTKGTGISGVRGMLPRQGKIIRPLLFSTKNKIVEYAQTSGLEWREDSSNLSTKYKRNLIRHKVMPLLKKINPALESTFLHSQQRLMETEDILKMLGRELAAKYSFSKGRDTYFSLKGIKEGNAVLTEELLKPYGFNYFQAREIFEHVRSADTFPGKRFIAGHYQLNVDRKYIIISPRISQISEQFIDMEDNEVVNEVMKLKCSITENAGNLHKDKHKASLDLDRLTFPLTVRKWQQGDVFQPLGMKGKKKVSDFMIDEKIPLNLKERVCVLESEGQLVWVIGYRIDDRFKVRADTRKIFNIVLSGNDQSF